MGSRAHQARVRRAQADVLADLSRRPDLVIAGAGMAGLAAAAQAAELGAHALVLEKGPVPGGSMRLSSGVVWRFRDRDTFRAECPGGDPSLQALIVDRLDDDLAWLEALGAPVRERCTANSLTEGRRFDVDGLTEALVRRVPELRVGKPLKSLPPGTPVVLATGGFQGDRELVRRFVTPEADCLWLRANPWSSGDGLRLALDAGAATTAAMDEFYGRNLPAPPAIVEDEDFVRLSQLYASHARIQAVGGHAYPAERIAWHESDVAQWVARQPGARAWYIVHPSRFESPAGAGRTVRESIEAAKAAGGPVEEGETGAAVLVAPGITSTLGGIQVDREARVIGRAGKPVPGLFVAGGDAGGISLGGYSSGLAAALVLGRAAARSALGACPA